MNMRSGTSAFLTGIATVFPALSMEYVHSQTLVVIIWTGYIISIITFVLGPQQWQDYRFEPVDPTSIILVRCFLWVSGGLCALATLESLEII